MGSLIIASAFNSAADTLCKTLLGVSFKSGVAVSSRIPDGRNRASVSNDNSVRALCASSTTTNGRRKRNTFANEYGTVFSGPGNRFARCTGLRSLK